MESLNIGDRLRQTLGKYKHAAVVVLIGLGLMLLPTGGGGNKEPSEPIAQEQPICIPDLEARLEEILESISGAGDVKVLLTERSGQEIIYQTDDQSDQADASSRQTNTTVIVENADNTNTGLIRRTDSPVYQGAVVVCQGGDNPQVRLAIVEAVQCATGLGTNQISVVKMK